MKIPALQLESSQHRDLKKSGKMLALTVATATWKIDLAGKTVRDLASTLSEFIDVSKSIEPYAGLPAMRLEFPKELHLAPGVRHTISMEFKEPTVDIADGEKPPIFRVIDPNDPDEDFLQVVEVFL